MYAAFISEFSRDCCSRIATGHSLSAAELDAFRTLLAARELHGGRLLGPMAGPDPAFDTVSGRCGVRPAFRDLPAAPTTAQGSATN